MGWISFRTPFFSTLRIAYWRVSAQRYLLSFNTFDSILNIQFRKSHARCSARSRETSPCGGQPTWCCSNLNPSVVGVTSGLQARSVDRNGLCSVMKQRCILPLLSVLFSFFSSFFLFFSFLFPTDLFLL